MTNESQAASAARWYGVASGNGNDGVSQLYPDYYVKTDAPWRLAELAALSTFKAGNGQAWCKAHLEIDGEADYTISAVLSDPPCEDSADGEYPELGYDNEKLEDAEDGRNWSEGNGAWQIFEIFPADTDDLRSDVPMFESLDEAFSAPELAITDAA